MKEEKVEEVLEETGEKKEETVDKGKEFADSLIAKKEESDKAWDGKGLYKTIKFLILLSIIFVVVLELFFYIWPKIEHNFPENIPVLEKCKKAECDSSCNGSCTCKYINIYEREETVTCIIK